MSNWKEKRWEKEPTLYKVIRPLARWLLKVVYRAKVVGLENIPSEGSVVLAGNHKNYLDPVFVMGVVPRVVWFLAKVELTRGIAGLFFPYFGIIPVDRSIHDKQSLQIAMDYLDEGRCVGIFPEGTFNESEQPVLPFKVGAVKMALGTGSPVVPFTITGAYRPFRRGLTLTFYPPLPIEGMEVEQARMTLQQFISNRLEESNGYQL